MLLVGSAAALAALTAVLALVASGGLRWLSVVDPDVVVRIGLPLARGVQDVTAATTIGLLVLAAVALPDPSGDRWALSGERELAVRWAGCAAAAWAAAAVTVLVLSCSDLSGFGPGAAEFGSQLVFFVAHVELGQILAVAAGLALLVSCLALSATRATTAAWAAVLALSAMLTLSLSGHSAGADDHINEVNSLAAHLVAVTIWVGGAIALLLLAGRIAAPGLLARRYSRLAGWCFVVVALSGLDAAWLRLGSFRELATGYGALLLVKASILILLGVLGGRQRRRVLPRLERPGSDRGALVRLLSIEVGLMALAIGVAVALTRSVPPVADHPTTGPTAAYQALVGFVPPPPLSWTSILTQWYPDWLLVGLIAALAGSYVVGARRLIRRGDRWPWLRTLAWLVGCAVLLWTTSGGPTVYGLVTFSGHMIMHMLLMMGVPPLLVLGAPTTLALRAIPARTDASAGPREWLLALVHSRALRILTHPVVAAVLFSGSLVVFYYSPLFGLALSTHTGHMLMTAYFLLTGYLFCWVVIGTDPGPPRVAYPIRLIVILSTMAVHAFFAVSLMSQHAGTREPLVAAARAHRPGRPAGRPAHRRGHRLGGRRRTDRRTHAGRRRALGAGLRA